MSDLSDKIVALVEWNAAGHHQTFFRHFSAALLGSGATVIPLCPWKQEEIKDLVELCLGGEEKSAMGRFETPIPCNFPPSGSGRIASLRARFDQRRHFKRVAGNLTRWEQKSRKKIDLVFFCCIYDPQFAEFPRAARFLRWPWSGLYLDSRFVRKPGTLRPYSLTPPRPDQIFSAPGLQSLAILDEGIIEETKELTQGRPVVWFPDIADFRIADPAPTGGTIGEKIKKMAGGRKIVGCLGHLQKTKGLLELIRAAKDARLENVFFVFVGEANLFRIPPEEQAEIIEAWEHSPQIFCHPLRVAEPTYNSAFKACDIIAAAYTDFPNSSNTLTKAAAFSKPIVVNDGYLMAERVRKYQLGEVVPEGDQNALTEALVSLTSDSPAWTPEQAQWDAYLTMHSPTRLKEAFQELLNG